MVDGAATGCSFPGAVAERLIYSLAGKPPQGAQQLQEKRCRGAGFRIVVRSGCERCNWNFLIGLSEIDYEEKQWCEKDPGVDGDTSGSDCDIGVRKYTNNTSFV